MSDPELRRAKHNEHMKLFTGTLNAVGLGILGWVVVKPLVTPAQAHGLADLQWGRIALGILFCAAAHYVIRWQR